MREKNDPKSMALMALAMAIFGTIGIFRKMIPLSSAWVAFFRGAIGSLFLILFVMAGRKRGKGQGFDKATTAKLVISGALIGINWALLFEAYNWTSVSIATLCYYMAPTFVIVLSCVLLHEKMTWLKAACTTAAFAGMVLVSGVLDADSVSKADTRGILFGLGAAVLYASVVLTNKTIKAAEPFKKTIIQLTAATIVLIPYLILKDGMPDVKWNAEIIALLITVGIVHTGLSYALYFGSMDGLRTHTVALFSYIDPVTALILSAVLLHEELTMLGIAGAVLILGSAVISGLKE